MVDVCYVVLGLMVCVSVALDEVVLKSWEVVGWILMVVPWVFCWCNDYLGCSYDDVVFVV